MGRCPFFVPYSIDVTRFPNDTNTLSTRFHTNTKEINHWCVLCGVGYHACDSCNKEKRFTPWRILTDTIEHYKIFMVLKDYNNKVISREQARELLSGLDLSDRASFKDSAKKVLSDIYGDAVTEGNEFVEPTTEHVSKRKTRKTIKTETENEIILEDVSVSDE